MARAVHSGGRGRLATVLLPRGLHPLAWWVWAVGLAVAATRTSNPVLLALVLAVAGLVVAARRGDAPWARAFRIYLVVGLVIIAIRIVFRILLGAAPEGSAGHLIFRLPVVPLPGWVAGIHVGGRIEVESVLAAAYDGLRLATMLCCVGAANALANPKRALRSLPGALYEIGIAVVVALTMAPQMIESGQRVLRARRLRGETGGRFRLLHRVVLPVLQDALTRSLSLAAAMDSRGYGRTSQASPAARCTSAALLLGALIALAVGAFGVLDPGTTGPYGLPTLLVGAALACAGLWAGGRRVSRSRYRPDRWLLPEWVVAGSGVVAAAAFLGPGTAAVLNPSLQPLQWPQVALVPVLGLLVAAVPAIAAPMLPRLPGRASRGATRSTEATAVTR